MQKIILPLGEVSIEGVIHLVELFEKSGKDVFVQESATLNCTIKISKNKIETQVESQVINHDNQIYYFYVSKK